MNRRCLAGWAMAAALLGAGVVAQAAPPPKVQAEVNALLAGIEASGCTFHRNGTWHDSKAAAAHLRDKYDYLAARDLIVTTEDFIERAATRSSLSGQAYEVKCGDAPAVGSSGWLNDQLAHLRPH